MALLGCESSAGTAAQGASGPDDISDLLPYEGPMRVLFDDAIDAEAFSESTGIPLSSGDSRLVERIRMSTFVVPVVVVTATDDQQANSGLVELELLPVDPPFRGELTAHVRPGEPIRVSLPPSSAGYALVRSNQRELVGKRLNLCWSRFSRGGGGEVHWHAFSDAPRTRLAIEKAAAVVNVD